jgi:segregation and condensation protein B
MNEFYTRNVLEAALLAAGKSLTVAELGQLFDENVRPKVDDIRTTLDALAAEYSNRGLEVKETAAGFRIQVRREFASEISRLWPERPARYSRALLETLALIAYRQPITRAEIEAVRGVAVNPNIVKTVIERNWVRVVGHRDVPGRPELLGTTRDFLDYFGLRSLDELPALAELKAMGDYNLQLELPNAGALGIEGEGADVAAAAVALLTSEGAVGADAVDGAIVAATGEADVGGVVADAAVLEATFVDVTVVDVEAVSQGEGSHRAEAGANHVDGDAAHDAVAEAGGAHDEGSHHAEAAANHADGEAAHDAVGSGSSHDEPAQRAVSSADADDREADRTLSSGDAAKHAAESDDSDASESTITGASPDALEDAADDDADEDELSADGHGSRELVAAPRDIDD